MVILGLHWGCIGVVLGLHWVFILNLGKLASASRVLAFDCSRAMLATDLHLKLLLNVYLVGRVAKFPCPTISPKP